MKKNTIGKIVIIIGCLILIIGIGITIKNNYLNDSYKENNNKPNKDSEEDLCIKDIQNVNFKNIALDYGDTTIKVDFMNCANEEPTTEANEKKYKSKDEKYSISVKVIEKNAKDYYDELYDLYFSKSLYSISRYNQTTKNNILLYTMSALTTNEKNEATSQEYLMIAEIDDKCVCIQINYTSGKLESGFFTEIADSIEIIKK